MRLLITGSNGQLGNELKRCLSNMRAEIGPISDEYAGCEVDFIDYAELDISNEDSVKRWFSKRTYDLVINCAAYTNVDGCEVNEEAAYQVNALGPKYLARETKLQDARFVQVSTDYVFPGDDPEPRKEDDLTNPISAYGRTKLAGEQLALAENKKTFVVRTAWLYGYVGNNFVKTMQRLGKERNSIAVVDDQFGNPTSANDLAYEILQVALTENYGIYHCTNEGTCSWHDFATHIMELSGIACEVKPITSRQYKEMNPASANRPQYSSLTNQRLAETIGNEMRPWLDALKTFISNGCA